MGNCLRRDSAAQWGGDHWSFSPAPDSLSSTNTRNLLDQNDDGLDQEQETKNTEGKGLLVGGSKSSGKEVKIRISKKQLVEILGRVDTNELTVEQVLAHFIKITDDFPADHRPWKPNLQSIPE